MSTNYTIDINAKDNTKGAIAGVGGGLTGLSNKAGKLKIALGAAAIAGAGIMAGKAVLNAIDNMDSLAKSARQSGSALTNEAFQGFQVLGKAMEEAGIDQATYERALLQTNSRLKAGTEGQKSFAKITDKLGDSIKQQNGDLKSGPDLLVAMTNALNAGTISTEEFAKVVGGRAGPLIQEQFASMNTSAEGLQATLDDVKGSTNIVDLDAANNAEAFNDTIGRLKEGMGQIMTDAITPMLPVLRELAEKLMAKMPDIIAGVTKAFDALKPVMKLLGTLLTEVIWPILSKVFDVLGTIATAITPLIEKSIPLLKTGFETAGKAIQGLVDFFVKLIEKIKAIPEEVKKMKDAIVGKMGDMVTSTKKKLTGWKDSVLGIFKDTEDEAVGNSIIPDMVDAIIGEFTRMKDVTIDTTQAMSDGVTGTMDTGMKKFTDVLTSAFDDGKLEMNDFKGFFKQTMSQMIKDAIFGTNKISQSLSIGSSLHGSGGSKKSGIGSIIGSIFKGFFGRASGGPVTKGKSYIVGEQGQETFTPSSNGSISRNNGASGADGGLTVNFNISSIDSRSGTEFIMEQKNQIVGMINQAYRKRGKMGI